MNKTTVAVLIALAVIVLGGLGVYVFANRAEPAQTEELMMEDEAKEEDSMMQEDEMMEEDSVPGDDAMMDNKGSYVPFTPEVLASAASRRRVLYFYANWCPTCIPADANFKANTSKIPEDVTLIRVNYNDTDTDDTERALAVKYGITYQHTFVQIDGSGNEVSKWNGGQIKELLDHLI